MNFYWNPEKAKWTANLLSGKAHISCGVLDRDHSDRKMYVSWGESTDHYFRKSLLLDLTCWNTPYFMLLHCQILMINIFQPWKMVTLSTFPHFNFHLGTSEKKRWHTILKVFSLSIIKILTINIISKLIE